MTLKTAKKHVMAALVLPGLIMTLFAIVVLYGQSKKIRSLEMSRDFAYIASEASYIASHTLPAESIVTTWFHQGRAERSEMIAARADSDAAASRLLAMLAEKVDERPDLAAVIRQIWSGLEAASAFRTRSDVETLTPKDVRAMFKPYGSALIDLVSMLRFEIHDYQSFRKANFLVDLLRANDAALDIGFYTDTFLQGGEFNVEDRDSLTGAQAVFKSSIRRLESYAETPEVTAALVFSQTDAGVWLDKMSADIEHTEIVASRALYEQWLTAKTAQMHALQKDLLESSRQVRVIGDSLASRALFEFSLLLGGSAFLVVMVLVILVFAVKSLRFSARLLRERELLIGELRAAAHHDLLTGLYNRRGFDAAVVLAMRDQRLKSAVLVILDLDKFKQINDTHGHDVGDIVLQQAAAVARLSFRDGDLLARHGGEEFLAFLPNTTLEDAVSVAERVRQDIEAMRIAAPQVDLLRVTASFGCAVVSGGFDRDAINKSLKIADLALYTAKAAGRNRVVSEADISAVTAVTTGPLAKGAVEAAPMPVSYSASMRAPI